MRLRTGLIAASLAAVAAATACTAPNPSAGTTLFGTPPIPHAAGQYPRLIVEDHTSSRWPVRWAVAQWSLANTSFGTCVSGVPCVVVTEVGNLPASNEIGLTRTTWAPTDPSYPQQITIQFSDNDPSSAAQRAQAACHEFGHAYGLNHDLTGGCMNASVGYGQTPFPSSADRARLAQIYTSR